MNAWLRALRRVDAPVSHSQGFHAHPKVSFSTASPVGEESICDFMDIVLREKVVPSELTQRLNAALPEGLFVSDAKEVPMDAPSLMSLLAGFAYSVHLPQGLAEMDGLKSQIDALAKAETIPFERDGKRGPVTLDVRPMLRFLALRTGDNGELIVDYTTAVIEGKSLRPRDLAVLLGLPFERLRVEKTSTCLAEA
jgi:radical SAM-linked protein